MPFHWVRTTSKSGECFACLRVRGGGRVPESEGSFKDSSRSSEFVFCPSSLCLLSPLPTSAMLLGRSQHLLGCPGLRSVPRLGPRPLNLRMMSYKPPHAGDASAFERKRVQAGSWPPGDADRSPAVGSLWPPLIPLGLQQLPQVVVWVFAPASDFLPQPQPAPGCGDRICTAPTSAAPNNPGEGASPMALTPTSPHHGLSLSGCLWSSNQDERGRVVGR